jgi:hypothetical protein
MSRRSKHKGWSPFITACNQTQISLRCIRNACFNGYIEVEVLLPRPADIRNCQEGLAYRISNATGQIFTFDIWPDHRWLSLIRLAVAHRYYGWPYFPVSSEWNNTHERTAAANNFLYPIRTEALLSGRVAYQTKAIGSELPTHS